MTTQSCLDPSPARCPACRASSRAGNAVRRGDGAAEAERDPGPLGGARERGEALAQHLCQLQVVADRVAERGEDGQTALSPATTVRASGSWSERALDQRGRHLAEQQVTGDDGDRSARRQGSSEQGAVGGLPVPALACQDQFAAGQERLGLQQIRRVHPAQLMSEGVGVPGEQFEQQLRRVERARDVHTFTLPSVSFRVLDSGS